jgi:predicted transcriptional regulator
MTLLTATPEATSIDEVAELDRRWAAVEAGEPTVPHDDVVKWLRSWGTPAFKSWPDR